MKKKIGLFYGTSTTKTAMVAKKLVSALDGYKVDIIPVEDAWKQDFEEYENIIIGTSTWFDGELPSYWDEVRPELEALDLKGKKIAIFGLGDQKKYPDNFADGIGILAEVFEAGGARIVGQISPEGYTFNSSKALKDGKFSGLILDIENQSNLTDDRIKNWAKQLSEIFG